MTCSPPTESRINPKRRCYIILTEINYHDGLTWEELIYKPIVFKWDGISIKAGVLQIGVSKCLSVREQYGELPIMYIQPDNTVRLNVRSVSELHIFSLD